LITAVTAVASVVLVTQVAAADPVQEQLRLMEQRMSEMEDRLQATSDELRTARETVDQQQGLLSDAGLIDEGNEGLRSGVGSFFDLVDVSGVAAASFNHRLHEHNNRGNVANVAGAGGNGGYLKYPNSNTFQVDQIWMTVDKQPTDESRGGFHFEYVTGESAQAQNFSLLANDDEPFLYSGYVSYLAPLGNGVRVDLGKLATPLGAEVIQTNKNFFITQGAVFALQPVTHTGVSATTQVTDEVAVVLGVVNDVYSDTATSTDADKAYYGQVQFGGDGFGLNVGGIIGNDGGACNGPTTSRTSACRTSVLDVVLTADPTDDLSLWANFDWKHTNGSDTSTGVVENLHGDAYGIAVAGRLGITETMGVASRLEYVQTEDSLNGTQRNNELVTLTGTLDKTLAEGLVTRVELRWDTVRDDNNNGAGFQASNGGLNDDQLVGLWQLYYEF
jgi:hypothetical protein